MLSIMFHNMQLKVVCVKCLCMYLRSTCFGILLPGNQLSIQWVGPTMIKYPAKEERRRKEKRQTSHSSLGLLGALWLLYKLFIQKSLLVLSNINHRKKKKIQFQLKAAIPGKLGVKVCFAHCLYFLLHSYLLY